MLAGFIALNRLNVSALDLVERFIKTGESTIMVYFSADPTEACKDVSLFAAVHRGIAKFFSDSSALNIDTLFGFALSTIDYGDHFFTGPNAQIGSYMLCNYSYFYNIIGIATILAYFSIVRVFSNKVVYSKYNLPIILFPLVITSINAFAQDYYQGISDITLIFIISILFFIFMVVYEASKRNINNNISL